MKILLLIFLLCTSCAAKKISTNTEVRDSVHVQIREKVIVVHDTVTIEIPLIVEKKIVDVDSSYLKNKFAESTAIILNDGKLFHSLATIYQEIDKEIETIVMYKDTIVYRDRVLKEFISTEKELSWFQGLQIRGFWILLVIVAIYILITKIKL